MSSEPAGVPSTGMGCSAGTAFCTSCGSAASSCPGCRRDLDPPRFCAECGRRLAVQVTPGGYRARCRQHGELASP